MHSHKKFSYSCISSGIKDKTDWSKTKKKESQNSAGQSDRAPPSQYFKIRQNLSKLGGFSQRPISVKFTKKSAKFRSGLKIWIRLIWIWGEICYFAHLLGGLRYYACRKAGFVVMPISRVVNLWNSRGDQITHEFFSSLAPLVGPCRHCPHVRLHHHPSARLTVPPPPLLAWPRHRPLCSPDYAAAFSSTVSWGVNSLRHFSRGSRSLLPIPELSCPLPLPGVCSHHGSKKDVDPPLVLSTAWMNDDEDINTLAIIIPSIEILGPIT
jgi:hypothetical protein